MRSSTKNAIAVVFDLGGVLIDWDPRHLYLKLFNGDEAAVEKFLAEICTQEWHYHHDLGRSFSEGVKLLSSRYPGKRALIEAWEKRFDEMISGPINGTVDILSELAVRQTPIYAMTNFPAEAFPRARKRFDFFKLFLGIVVSGEERAAKPDPLIYRVLMERYEIKPSRAVFIDDSKRNVAVAKELGFRGIEFASPEALRLELQDFGLL